MCSYKSLEITECVLLTLKGAILLQCFSWQVCCLFWCVHVGPYVCVHVTRSGPSFLVMYIVHRDVCEFQCVSFSVCVQHESVVVKRQSEKGVNRAH